MLLNLGYRTNFTCDLHKEWDEELTARAVANKYFNNEPKYTNDLIRKEQILISKRDKE